MSSHHIVLENQEPALLVLSPNILDGEHFGQLLEWSPTIISNEDNVDFLLAKGIKIDVIFAQVGYSILQEKTKVFPIKNSFIFDALQYMVNNNYATVNILADELPTEINRFTEQINIVLFTPGRRYAFVKNMFEKWKPKGELMFLDEHTIKSFQGLNYVDKGVFETYADGFVTLEFNTSAPVGVGEKL